MVPRSLYKYFQHRYLNLLANFIIIPPHMKILDRYLLKEFLFYLLGSLALFTILYFFGDFLSKVWRYKVPMATSLKYFTYLVPQTAHRMFTVACLTAPLLTLASMARNNEIVAMSAAGLSTRRLTVLLLSVTFLVGLAFFFIGNRIIPQTSAAADEIFYIDISKRTVPATQQNFWTRQGNLIFQIGRYASKEEKLENIRVYRMDGNFHLTQIDFAPECKITGNACRLQGGESIHFNSQSGNALPSRKSFEELSLSFDTHLIKMLPYTNAETASIADLRKAIHNAEAGGVSDTRFRVALHGKIAYVLACVIMTFLGIPFGLRSSGKRGGIAREGCFGLIAVLSFWFCVTLALSFGYAGMLPPILAAWIPNFAFVMVGMILFRSLRHA